MADFDPTSELRKLTEEVIALKRGREAEGNRVKALQDEIASKEFQLKLSHSKCEELDCQIAIKTRRIAIYKEAPRRGNAAIVVAPARRREADSGGGSSQSGTLREAASRGGGSSQSGTVRGEETRGGGSSQSGVTIASGRESQTASSASSATAKRVSSGDGNISGAGATKRPRSSETIATSAAPAAGPNLKTEKILDLTAPSTAEPGASLNTRTNIRDSSTPPVTDTRGAGPGGRGTGGRGTGGRGTGGRGTGVSVGGRGRGAGGGRGSIQSGGNSVGAWAPPSISSSVGQGASFRNESRQINSIEDANTQVVPYVPHATQSPAQPNQPNRPQVTNEGTRVSASGGSSMASAAGPVTRRVVVGPSNGVESDGNEGFPYRSATFVIESESLPRYLSLHPKPSGPGVTGCVLADNDGTVQMWDLDRSERAPTVSLNHTIKTQAKLPTPIAWNQTGTHFAMGHSEIVPNEGGAVTLISTEDYHNPKVVSSRLHNKGVCCVAWMGTPVAASNHLVTGGDDAKVVLWYNLLKEQADPQRSLLHKEHTSKVLSLFCMDTDVISGAYDSRVLCYDVPAGKVTWKYEELRKPKNGCGINSIARLGQRSPVLLLSAVSHTNVWHSLQLLDTRTPDTHTAQWTVSTGSGAGAPTNDGKFTLMIHPCVSDCGTYVACGTTQNTVQVWDIRKMGKGGIGVDTAVSGVPLKSHIGKGSRTVTQPRIQTVAFVPGRNDMVSLSTGRTLGFHMMQGNASRARR